jgi:hypothetical protein
MLPGGIHEIIPIGINIVSTVVAFQFLAIFPFPECFVFGLSLSFEQVGDQLGHSFTARC